jgi:hypothetical protein
VDVQDGGGRVVRELAHDLGITSKEAMALCTVSGVDAPSPERRLTAEEVERVRAVLEGRAAMVVTGAPQPKGRVVVGVAIAVAVLLAVGVVAVLASNVVNQEARIAIQPGQCFDEPGTFGAVIEPVVCDGPHDYRVEAVLDLREVYDDEFPGWDAIARHAEERCGALGAGEVTNSLTGPVLQFVYFGPQTAQAWEHVEARKIVCAVPSGD